MDEEQKKKIADQIDKLGDIALTNGVALGKAEGLGLALDIVRSGGGVDELSKAYLKQVQAYAEHTVALGIEVGVDVTKAKEVVDWILPFVEVDNKELH